MEITARQEVVVVRLYLLLFIIAGIQSCTSKDSCNNPFKIFEISESTPILQIENGASIEQIIASFEETFLEADEDDLCYQEYIFGWQLSDQIIKTHFTLYCPMKTSRRPPARAVEILLNQQGKVLLNKEIFLEIDSIDNWLLNDFSIIDEEEIFTKEISIIWRDDVPLKYYEAAILEMVNGYQLRFNKISKKQFNKSYCDLNEKENLIVENIFPYKFVLDIGLLPPPPPPPNYEKE